MIRVLWHIEVEKRVVLGAVGWHEILYNWNTLVMVNRSRVLGYSELHLGCSKEIMLDRRSYTSE
jgi:hypothetical protein